jgi:hypothetical protein
MASSRSWRCAGLRLLPPPSRTVGEDRCGRAHCVEHPWCLHPDLQEILPAPAGHPHPPTMVPCATAPGAPVYRLGMTIRPRGEPRNTTTSRRGLPTPAATIRLSTQAGTSTSEEEPIGRAGALLGGVVLDLGDCRRCRPRRHRQEPRGGCVAPRSPSRIPRYGRPYVLVPTPCPGPTPTITLAADSKGHARNRWWRSRQGPHDARPNGWGR